MKRSSKSVWSRFVMTFAAAFLLMLVTTVPVKADSSVPLVADMKQTDASTTSAGIRAGPAREVRFVLKLKCRNRCPVVTGHIRKASLLRLSL